MENKVTELDLNLEDRVIIGKNIKLIYMAQSGQQSRIGIEAPKHIVIDREEIHEKRVNNEIE